MKRKRNQRSVSSHVGIGKKLYETQWEDAIYQLRREISSETSPATPWSWTFKSKKLKWEKINICCLSCPDCGVMLWSLSGLRQSCWGFRTHTEYGFYPQISHIIDLICLHYFRSCFLLLSCVQHFATPWTAAHQASLSFTISWSLLKFMSIELVIPPNHLILCHPLLLHSIFPSIRDFYSESAFWARWPKHWMELYFSISPSNEYSGLISFRVDWFNLLAVQGMLKSLLHHQSSKASGLWCSAFWGASLVAKTVKNLPEMWDTWIWSLGWKDPLKEGMATQSSILAWRIPMDTGVWRVIVHGVAKSRTWLRD